jgi:hypothetical protein
MESTSQSRVRSTFNGTQTFVEHRLHSQMSSSSLLRTHRTEIDKSPSMQEALKTQRSYIKRPPAVVLLAQDQFEHIDAKVNTNNFNLKRSPKKHDFGKLGYHDISSEVRDINLKLHFFGLRKDV